MSWRLEDIPDLTGKVIIVTGANSGLGFETTKELARKRAKVVMACRSPERAELAEEKIFSEIPSADLEFMFLDLSSQKSVKDFAENFLGSHDRLDVLVNNAGIMAAPYSETVDGFENHFRHKLSWSLCVDGKIIESSGSDARSQSGQRQQPGLLLRKQNRF